MQAPVKAGGADVDTELLRAFEQQILARTPHVEGGEVVNPTPLLDITQALKECARDEYGLDLSDRDFRVFGKLEAPLLGGSVKSRAATQIVHEAIKSGMLRRGMVVFEATSGNFGIALGLLGNLGVKVVVLVSRKLQEGVLEELEKSNVKTVDLDVDVCPAPGMQMDPNMLLAKVVATAMRERFAEIGLDIAVFDSSRPRVEEFLARQDVINLAKVLADAYGGYCPEQYDNEQNVDAHATITGPEIDQQLRELGHSLGEFSVVCAFGTGGTSVGLSRYVQAKYGGKKVVHVVFPPEGKDVAGIRTKGKADGAEVLRAREVRGRARGRLRPGEEALRLHGQERVRHRREQRARALRGPSDGELRDRREVRGHPGGRREEVQARAGIRAESQEEQEEGLEVTARERKGQAGEVRRGGLDAHGIRPERGREEAHRQLARRPGELREGGMSRATS